MPQLAAILDEVFGSQPMEHWNQVFSGLRVTFGAVRGPQQVIEDPQLRANDIVVPLEGAGATLTSSAVRTVVPARTGSATLAAVASAHCGRDPDWPMLTTRAPRRAVFKAARPG